MECCSPIGVQGGGKTRWWEWLNIMASFPQKCIKTLRPLGVGLLGLANKNRGSLVKFLFQTINKYFLYKYVPCIIWDTLNTYLIRCLICYLVTLMRDKDRVMAEGLNTQNPGAPQVPSPLPHEETWRAFPLVSVIFELSESGVLMLNTINTVNLTGLMTTSILWIGWVGINLL